MSRHRSALAACVALLFLSSSAGSVVVSAQKRARVLAFSSVPAPKTVLGFTPGDDRTIADWSQITDYFARLDKASDRVLVQTLGQSTLKRPLIVALISARENILALQKYKEIQRQLADPRTLTDEIQRNRIIA